MLYVSYTCVKKILKKMRVIEDKRGVILNDIEMESDIEEGYL